MAPTHLPRAELHTHLGSSVDPVIMWTIAHQQGIKLPAKEYWDFEEMITMPGEKRNKDLNEMDRNFFHWTELIQSSPEAIEESVHSVIGGGYRKCNLVVQELRFNPMKRNRSGERDLDLIILSALWGMRRATLEYTSVRAGLIISLDRTFPLELNQKLLDKAIRYQRDGIVGIDIAGPDHADFSMQAHAPLIERARAAGLGVTIHAGETGNIDELAYVVQKLQPSRIGHGIAAAQSPAVLRMLREQDTVVELCPTSNIKNSVVSGVDELRTIVRTFVEAGVRITINTDGPEMYCTNVIKEEAFLVANGILSEAELAVARTNAFAASFVAPAA